jgi:transposase
MRCAVEIKLSEEERLVLERRIRARRLMTRDTLRARIVLLAAAGDTNKEIGTKLAVKEHTVAKWRKRFVHQRMKGLAEHEGRGRKRLYTAEKIAEVIEATLHGKPSGHTHWSTRTMANACGASHATINGSGERMSLSLTWCGRLSCRATSVLPRSFGTSWDCI